MAKEINEGRRNLSEQPFNAWYFNRSGEPYTDVAQVLSEVPESYRKGIDALKFIDGFEYWFSPDIFTVVKKGVAQDISGKVDKNNAIVGGTKTKITYDAKGLVTIGENATTADIDDSADKRYVSDAKKTVLENTSNTNTGDNSANTKYEPLLSNPYNWKLKSIVGLTTVAPTPPSAAELLSNKPWTAYGKSGAQVYKEELGDYVKDLSVPILTTDVVWKNTAMNSTDGVFNRCSVWSTKDATPGQYIGFGREVIVTIPKIYYIGVAADNYMSLEVNNVLIKSFPSGDTLEDHYNTWHILPVFLNAGSNIIHMVGYNDSGLAAFGAEIYDATLAELQGVATIAALDARTIFSTKSLIGGYVEEGNFGTGYTCPVGYALVNRAGVLSCDRLEYGTITVDNHDLVEFKKGTGSDFTALVDPLDSTHKIVEIPTSDNLFDIVLPNAGSVQARCDGVISLPEGWIISAAPDNQYDILISHYLNRRFAFATVTAVAGETEQLLRDNGAFSGATAQSKSVLRILGLTAKPSPLVIHLFFS